MMCICDTDGILLSSMNCGHSRLPFIIFVFFFFFFSFYNYLYILLFFLFSLVCLLDRVLSAPQSTIAGVHSLNSRNKKKTKIMVYYGTHHTSLTVALCTSFFFLLFIIICCRTCRHAHSNKSRKSVASQSQSVAQAYNIHECTVRFESLGVCVLARICTVESAQHLPGILAWK